jgi:hypothetical protein
MVILESSAGLSPLDDYRFSSEQMNCSPQRDKIRDANCQRKHKD